MQKNKILGDIFTSAAFLLVSIIFIAVIPSQISINLAGATDYGANSQTLPYIATSFIGFFALLNLIISIVRFIKLPKDAPKASVSFKRELFVLCMFVVCVVYYLLFTHVGYIVATLLVPPTILAMLKDKKWPHYASVLALGAVVFVLFEYLLNVRLP